MKILTQNGFSLMEMLMTMSLIGILTMVAIPSVNGILKNERLTTQINSLLAHLQFARSEALLRHKQVVVCASKDAATCSGNWSDGWIVFFDNDESADVSDGDALLQAHAKLSGDNVMNNTGGTTIIYDSRGFTPNSASTFSVCDDRGASKGKSITISTTGRVRSGGDVTC